MAIELSDVGCPECGHRLQVVYATPRKQVVTGWACPDCGFAAAVKDGFQGKVSEAEEFVLRIEKSLTTADVHAPRTDVRGEFRARAAESMAEDEVWMLIDPDDGSLVDIIAGEQGENEDQTSE